MRILLYGRLADTIDREVELEANDGCTIADVRSRLAADHPSGAAELECSRAAVGDRLVGDEHVIAATDCIEFLPPVSGG